MPPDTRRGVTRAPVHTLQHEPSTMARTGPRLKIVRRLGTPLPGLTRKSAERRPYPPGAHGLTAGRRKSEFRRRLEEKQKVRFHYGVTETQLRRAFEQTADRRGNTRLELLERRLDNVVFRLGWAPTIRAARQLVVHGHVRLDGRRVDRPAAVVGPGATISLGERARRMPAVADAVAGGPALRLPGYLERDPADPFAGRVVGRPPGTTSRSPSTWRRSSSSTRDSRVGARIGLPHCARSWPAPPCH